MDLDPSHYSQDEMIQLLGLSVVTEETVRAATQREIDRRSDNPEIVSFFTGIQFSLLNILQRPVNPDIKNIITRILHIDSSHLPDYSATATTDDFTFTLSDQINNVLSLSLVSVELPTSWYTFSATRGNTPFVFYMGSPLIKYNTLPDSPLAVPDGNYTVSSLLDKIKSLILTITNDSTSAFDYSINTSNGCISFYSAIPFKFMWNDITGVEDLLNSTHVNYNLGTMLGFSTVISDSVLLGTRYTLTATRPINVSGTRYVTLEVNDFSSNRISNNIVLMNSLPRLKAMPPEYYTSDIPQVRIGPNATIALSNGKLTGKQVQSINSTTEVPLPGRYLIARQASNLFAKIPIKKAFFPNYSNGSDEITEYGYTRHISELAGSIQSNTREYFGPITLRSLEVSLYDDRGFPLGLNGIHWSCSIIVRSLYQKK